MATATVPTFTEDQVVQIKVPWAVYETLVETLGDDSHVRLTYDGEFLEIMSPGKPHDFLASIIGQMISTIRDEWPIEITGFQSATFKVAKHERGFEGDQSYYIGDMESRFRDVWNPDLATEPAPDLVLEVDITHKSSEKFETFVRLGVPELWHYTRNVLAWHSLVGDIYVPITTSRVIRGLPLVEVAKRVAAAHPGKTKAFIADWRKWLQANVHLHEAAKAAD